VPDLARHARVRFNREALGGPVQGYSPAKVLRFIRKSAGAPSVTAGDPWATFST